MRSGNKSHKFEVLYQKQIEFQQKIIEKYQSHLSDANLPQDNPELFQYHMTSVIEEMGEVLKADKRWKTHRNDTFIPENKIDELSDVFICLMNVSIYSGYNSLELLESIERKIHRNAERIKNS